MTTDGKLSIDGDINILGDASVGGDLEVKGKVKAKSVETEKINISTPAATPDGKNHASTGSGTLLANTTEIVIETTAVTTESKIFVTATTSTGGQALVVIEKTAGESFKVILNAPLTTEVKFDWWVVN